MVPSAPIAPQDPPPQDDPRPEGRIESGRHLKAERSRHLVPPSVRVSGVPRARGAGGLFGFCLSRTCKCVFAGYSQAPPVRGVWPAGVWGPLAPALCGYQQTDLPRPGGNLGGLGAPRRTLPGDRGLPRCRCGLSAPPAVSSRPPLGGPPVPPLPDYGLPSPDSSWGNVGPMAPGIGIICHSFLPSDVQSSRLIGNH